MSSLAQRGLDTLSGMNKGMTRTNFQTEKERMRHGEEFNMNDPQLVRDREQCKAALSRFNTSAASGVSSDERERQLRSILEPEGQTQQMHPATASRLGKNVTVEAPFRCDYGYSLNIRDHVLIEAGCVITDAAEVKICEGAHIGPEVKIKSRVIPRDPRVRVDRAGGQIRKAKGIRIVIEEGVYIGDGVIIAPEWDTKGGDNGGLLRIGAYSYILPGTVVRKVSICFHLNEVEKCH
jgi:acetyltransferase-like isoleucine patch superfamily enzyme